ncbi:carboxymuconolactone decarboxylase family protein [Noviherbaspirillum sedimenti]|uniref:Carboxymuconolactone decarboxylase family protein n=2 Tax=Noviherbaspirillum sedimenti TaxID=2320865 RepID=A0A3A3GCU3_9BURK|nr:carboxymuconolactone decarboxylase family protein [Noviherbaspirillum sedimenti]
MRSIGNWNPAWNTLAELDEAWLEKFMQMNAHAVRKGLFDPLTLEFIAIAVDASCTHMYAPGVRRHIRKALELGASKEQILALLQMVSVVGIHSVAMGVPILVEEAESLTKDGPVKGSF